MLSAFIDWRRRLPSSRAVQLAANYWKLYDVNVTQHYMESKEQDIPLGSKMLSAPLSSLAHLRSSRREIYSYMFTKRRDFAVLADSTCVEAAVTAMLRVQKFFYGTLSDDLFAVISFSTRRPWSSTRSSWDYTPKVRGQKLVSNSLK